MINLYNAQNARKGEQKGGMVVIMRCPLQGQREVGRLALQSWREELSNLWHRELRSGRRRATTDIHDRFRTVRPQYCFWSFPNLCRIYSHHMRGAHDDCRDLSCSFWPQERLAINPHSTH